MPDTTPASVARTVIPFERSRVMVRRGEPQSELNGTLTWQHDEHLAFDHDLDHQGARRCYTTGVSALDEVTLGIMQGNVLLVAGGTGGGKSSFALTTALTLSCIAESLPVLYVSLEMPARDMAIRSLAWLTGIPQTRLLHADIGRVKLEDHERQLISVQGQKIRNRLRMMAGSFTVGQVRAEAKRMQDECGLSVIVLDHVGLVDAEGSSKNTTREREVAATSRGFKKIVMELNVGGLMLAQLNRAASKEKEPELYHLRESGSLEQDATSVAFLWRTEDNAPDRRRIFVRKNRFGTHAELEVPWDGATGRIGDVVEWSNAEAGDAY